MKVSPHTAVTLRILAAAVILFLAVSGWAVFEYKNSLLPPQPTIAFSGTGTVKAEHDTARISFTFSELDTDVIAARDTVRKQVAEAYARLKESGIAEKDIQTVRYSLDPEYEYIQLPEPPFGQRKEFRGYRVNHTTSLDIRDIDSVGTVLDIISNIKPEHIGNLVLTFDDEKKKELGERAMVMAITEARARARRIADKSDLRLGGIVSVSNGTGRNRYSREYSAKLFSAEAASADAAPVTAVASGEGEIKRTVTIEYELHE